MSFSPEGTAEIMDREFGDATPAQPGSTEPGLNRPASSHRAPNMQPPRKYFLPYQSAWIADRSRLKICEKGRQIGLSYADSYDSVRKAASKSGRDVWVMSRDEVQAKQYIRCCKHWANVLKHAAQDYGERIFMTDRGRAVTVQVLTFASKASIYALSSNPDAIVGKSGHVKLDEFALHKDQRLLYRVAKPVTQWGGTLCLISTHRGAGTVFNQILGDIKERGNPMGWSLHTIPIQKAVAEGLVEKVNQASGGALAKAWKADTDSPPHSLMESATSRLVGTHPLTHSLPFREWWLARLRAECIDEEQWLQEYCCIPADESAAFISYDMIHACEDPDCLKDFDYLSHSSYPSYLGVDLARKKDLCVLDLGEKIGDVVWDRLRLELSNKSFSEIRTELYRLLRLPALRRACIDATGLGMQLAEEARAEFGWKVEPITFTAAVKEELAFGLRADFEDRKLRLPRDDKLSADLRGIKKEVSLGGNIRFVGESEDSHCDRFWAKALRQHAARAKSDVWAGVA